MCIVYGLKVPLNPPLHYVLPGQEECGELQKMLLKTTCNISSRDANKCFGIFTNLCHPNSAWESRPMGKDDKKVLVLTFSILGLRIVQRIGYWGKIH